MFRVDELDETIENLMRIKIGLKKRQKNIF